MDTITHVLSSPLTRTLETALRCFAPVYARGTKVIAWDQLVELGSAPCNTGAPLAVLKETWKGSPIELGSLRNGYENSSNERSDKDDRLRNIVLTLYEFCHAEAAYYW